MTACPRCGEHAAQGQEYCLSCGTRLPGFPLRGRDPGAGWALRALLTAAIAFAGGAVAIAATGGDGGRDEVITAIGGFATTPSSTTLPSPAGGGPEIGDWPTGRDGWTIALASLPQTEGRRAAVARARRARARGLPEVGILDSSRYASLHPGYWVVFSGVYSSEAEATSALEPARRVVRTATVRRVVP